MLPVWSVRGSSEARRPRDESRRSPHERGPGALAELPPGWGVFIRVRFASCPAGSDSPPRRSPTRMKVGHLPAVCAAERSGPCDPATPGDVRLTGDCLCRLCGLLPAKEDTRSGPSFRSFDQTPWRIQSVSCPFVSARCREVCQCGPFDAVISLDTLAARHAPQPFPSVSAARVLSLRACPRRFACGVCRAWLCRRSRSAQPRIKGANCRSLYHRPQPPSGVSEPSRADQTITRKLKDGLARIEVRVLDHIIVGEDCVSFAERGLLCGSRPCRPALGRLLLPSLLSGCGTALAGVSSQTPQNRKCQKIENRAPF
jgi:hypothetical protein